MGRAERLRREARAQALAAPGTVAMLASTIGRYTAAAQCFTALELPPNAHREWHGGGVDISRNRNLIAETFAGDWLLMVDDDQVFLPNMAMRLLAHLADDRVDIVVPLILRRYPPYGTVLVRRDGAGTYERVKLTTERGLIEVDGAGTGVMLVRRRVFDRVGGPPFVRTGDAGPDIYFCSQAKAAGCRVWCDLETRVGHIAPMVIWPSWRDGRWAWACTGLGGGPMAASVKTIQQGHDLAGGADLT